MNNEQTVQISILINRYIFDIFVDLSKFVYLQNWGKAIRPIPDDRKNKNRTTEYYCPDDQTGGPNVIVRPNNCILI